MTRILVVEGNSPEIHACALKAGWTPAAENYAAVLGALAPGLETRITRPLFPGHAPEAVVLDDLDGVVFTGSGVAWSADAPEVAGLRRMMERALGAGLPVLGSCFGLQLGVVVLGGRVRTSPAGDELPIARAIRLTEAGQRHPFHAGRAPVFDCPCIHRDEVAGLPAGAVLTATNDHSAVQAMVCEQGGVRYWAVQYHPEMALAEIARIMRCSRGAVTDSETDKGDDPVIADYIAASEDPAANADALARHRIAPEVVEFAARTAELANWLAAIGATAARHQAAE